jgi:hypothetical protein
MSIYSARRSPFPYHLKIGDTGLLLGTAGPNKPMLVSSKVQDIAQVSPPDFSYAGMSPIGDRDQPYESLVLGYGLRTQRTWQDRRYAAANAVDLSVWPWCKGPEIVQHVPPVRAVNDGVSAFFELGGVLYVAQGRYIMRRDNDTSWPIVKDFGAGIAVLNVVVFTSNFDGTQRVFVALSTGPAQYSSNGTTWTPMATFGALAFCVIGREFWWADDVNRLRKCDTNADPTLEANYTSLIFRVGDKSSRVTALMVTAAGTLIINKTDGLYTLDQAGDDHELFPFLGFAAEGASGVNWGSINGANWGQFENSLYVAYGRSLLRINTDLSAEEVGPEKLVNNDSPVRGPVTAFAAVGAMFAYAATFNADTQDGYLYKFGGYDADPQKAEATHLDAWHGSISDLSALVDRRIQALHTSTIGAPEDHTRTYIGMSEGSLAYIVNPCVPNPAACNQYRFHVGDAWVDLPIWHGGYHASVKSLRHLSVTGARLDPQNYVTIDYKLDPAAASWTAFPNVFDSGTYEIAPMPTDASAVQAQFRVHLHNTLATASPLVSAVSIGHALRPKRYMQVELTVLCSDGLVRRDGVPMRIGRRQIQRAVEEAVDTPGAVRCTLPDESVQDLAFTDYAIGQSFDEIGRQWRGSLTIKAVQWDTVLTEV